MPKKLTLNEVIDRIKAVHGDRYVVCEDNVYVNNKTKIRVICREHGEFWIRPNDLITGYGCAKCAGNVQKTTEQFVSEAHEVHGDKYDYSRSEYKTATTKVCIVCPDHGEFWQTPLNHIYGGTGCPYCDSGNRSKAEDEVYNLLVDKGYRVERQKTFDWLVYEKRLRLDFYLPDYNVAIECQGEQHFRPIRKFGGEEGFDKQTRRDQTKRRLCEQHGVRLFYVRGKKIIIDEIVDYIENEASRSQTPTDQQEQEKEETLPQAEVQPVQSQKHQ